MTPKILQEIVSATKVLQAGGVVAFPTETVYGLGADVSNALAVNRIFEIKGRPQTIHSLFIFLIYLTFNTGRRKYQKQLGNWLSTFGRVL